jgi:hypothetical protein
MLNIGPPEFPELIVAVVWKNSASGIARYAVLGGTDHHHLLPYSDLVGIAESGRLSAGRNTAEPEQAQVGGGFGGDDSRGDDFAAQELHEDLVHIVDDVRGRHDLAVGGDQDAGADLGEGHEAAGAVDGPALGPDHDHRGADLPEQLLRILSLGEARAPPEDDSGENGYQ